ncbi:hypothetical protein QQF64_026170 [Cirrhinus molitorella]|uniref:Uncharacterized protein n=1 Tax=Cirrhinus molitorella TaxID=172907 RepID=A0ABR3NR32_9TELE
MGGSQTDRPAGKTKRRHKRNSDWDSHPGDSVVGGEVSADGGYSASAREEKRRSYKQVTQASDNPVWDEDC